jgi:hypothetical protein
MLTLLLTIHSEGLSKIEELNYTRITWEQWDLPLFLAGRRNAISPSYIIVRTLFSSSSSCARHKPQAQNSKSLLIMPVNCRLHNSFEYWAHYWQASSRLITYIPLRDVRTLRKRSLPYSFNRQETMNFLPALIKILYWVSSLVKLIIWARRDFLQVIGSNSFCISPSHCELKRIPEPRQEFHYQTEIRVLHKPYNWTACIGLNFILILYVHPLVILNTVE